MTAHELAQLIQSGRGPAEMLVCPRCHEDAFLIFYYVMAPGNGAILDKICPECRVSMWNCGSLN